MTARPRPDLSVVIPHHGGRTHLDACLRSLSRERRVATEIIVVDNASRDHSLAWLRGTGYDVRVVILGANRGYAAACNAGVDVAQGRVVAVINNDVEVRPGWDVALVETLDRHPDVAVVGALSLRLDDPSKVDSAGLLLAASFAGVDRQRRETDVREVAAVSGVCLAARRDWLRAEGRFDERFFMYYEDLELCLRAWLQGHRVLLVPDAVVLHAGGGTAGGRERAFRHFHTTRNRLLTAAKLLEPLQVPRVWLLSIASDLAAVGAHLLSGHPLAAARAFGGKSLGLLAACSGLPQVILDRRSLATGRRRTTHELRRAGLIQRAGRSAGTFAGRRRGSP